MKILKCPLYDLVGILTTNKTTLTRDDIIIDYNQRQEHEELMKQTQIEFQQQTTKIMLLLTKDFESFKSQLIMNPGTITQIFYELGFNPDINKCHHY